MTLPKELKTIQRITKGDKNCPDTVHELFNQKPINNRGRQRRADILVGKPGPTATQHAKTSQQQSMCLISFLQMK